MLITPETCEARIREIDVHTDGFIYMVSSAATTGVQKDFDTQKQAYFKKIQAFDSACANSSGAIIGSRFVSLLNESKGDAEKAIRQLKMEINETEQGW